MKTAKKSAPNNRVAAKLPVAATMQLTMNFGTNYLDNDPTQKELTWADLIQEFSVPDTTRGTLPLAEYLALDKKNKAEKKIRDREKDGPYFMMAAFSKPGTRLGNDVAYMSGFPGDIDTGCVDKVAIQAALNGFQYLAYSSYSHSVEVPMWRFVIPYSRPVSAIEHEKVYAYLQQAFNNQLDKRCKNTAQIWYTPACPPDAAEHFVFFTGAGNLLDPDQIPNVAPSAPTKNTALRAPPRAPLKSLPIHQHKRLESALATIPADDRDTWIRVGLALRHDLGTETAYKIWLEWSRKSSKFDECDAEVTWNSFKDRTTGETVTLGTVFHLAKEHGWSDPRRDMPEKVQTLDDAHFMAFEGGKCWVFKEGVDPELNRNALTRLGLVHFVSFYINEKVAVQQGESFKMRSIADIWIEHPARRSFERVVFMPGMPTPHGCYNLWKGFPVAPLPGNWALLHGHILDVICNGDTACADYLLNWMAFAIQHPERLGEVAVVMKGERGTGKGTLAKFFGLLFGEHTLQITQARHLIGNFNAHLRNCVFLFVDEALWAGDKQGENVLKGLVTEPTIQIERKGVDVCTAPNRLHIMMASNNEWVVPAGNRERRYFVLQVSDKHIQDSPYFAAIERQMLHQGGLEAMMHDLLQRNLSGFNVRKFPWTNALAEQVLLSLAPDMQWWMDYLGKTHIAWGFPVRSALSESFAQANGTFNSKSSETKLGMFLSKVVPGGVKKVVRAVGVRGAVQDCYQLPDQLTCRQSLMKQLGLKNDPWI